jgi:hypothetical protein
MKSTRSSGMVVSLSLVSGSRPCLRYRGGTRLDGRRIENSSPARPRVGDVDVADAYRTAPRRRGSGHAVRATWRRRRREPRQPTLARCRRPRARRDRRLRVRRSEAIGCGTGHGARCPRAGLEYPPTPDSRQARLLGCVRRMRRHREFDVRACSRDLGPVGDREVVTAFRAPDWSAGGHFIRIVSA